MITLEYYQKAKEYLEYDSDVGSLKWEKRPAKCIQIGDSAGSITDEGYFQTKITINGECHTIKNHRIAWYIIHNEIPEVIDHINGIKTDNRICNLRNCTDLENSHNAKKRKNNTSGYKGVAWHKSCNKWQAMIGVNYKNIHLGLFNTAVEAHIAYCKAADKYHGEFKRYA